MSTLQELSEGLADAVAAAKPSVVSIQARRTSASGVAWSDALVVTAAHALRRADTVIVTLPGGEEREATVVGRDPGTDLALLNVDGGGLTPATWAATLPRVGTVVLPLGARNGRVGATLGLLSDVAGPWQTSLGSAIDAWIDVDGSLPDGFSGGPLVDAAGQVVGLNTAGLTPRGAVLPQATVKRVVERLLERGTAAPGYLGVGFYPGTLAEAQATVAGQADALMAVSLEPGGPGEAAGVQVGDALVRIDGQPVVGLRHLMGLLVGQGAGATLQLTVLRAGVLVDVPITLAARPKRC